MNDMSSYFSDELLQLGMKNYCTTGSIQDLRLVDIRKSGTVALRQICAFVFICIPVYMTVLLFPQVSSYVEENSTEARKESVR